ncbi:hypothetical protein Tdes44962_MAKER02411 [Teratosphaeria destructans]|uniref:Uncharacterized protein n=1 Tax=Teratosphaeria destructans TaxID=418781 RepID=A0A9W7SU44_9PEZI|nr:hypothetical protein Tdes44962_MAKER02411 [Teratosphaeria destructans]
MLAAEAVKERLKFVDALVADRSAEVLVMNLEREDVVVVEENMFEEKTGWRGQLIAPPTAILCKGQGQTSLSLLPSCQ